MIDAHYALVRVPGKCSARAVSDSGRILLSGSHLNQTAKASGLVKDAPDGKLRYIRVVTLEDGETIFNAFFDRDFKGDKS
ncbi:MAG: hypothetical protein ACOY15_00410 [Pseudomonadota bacterium]